MSSTARNFDFRHFSRGVGLTAVIPWPSHGKPGTSPDVHMADPVFLMRRRHLLGVHVSIMACSQVRLV